VIIRLVNTIDGRIDHVTCDSWTDVEMKLWKVDVTRCGRRVDILLSRVSLFSQKLRQTNWPNQFSSFFSLEFRNELRRKFEL